MELTLDQALQKGIEAHRSGKAQEADRYYTAILKANPKHPDANHNMGVLAVGVDRIEAALPFFKTALETNSSIAQYWLSYIDALIKLNRFNKAKEEFEKAQTHGVKGLGFEKLKERLTRSVAVNSTNECSAPLQEQLGILKSLCTKKKWPKVFEKTQLLTEKYDNNLVLWNLLGTSAAQLGKFDEAILAYETAIKIKPDFAEAYSNMGGVLKENGKLEEAIRSYKMVLSIKPNFAEAHNSIGNVFKKQGKLEEAIEAYKKALSIKPNYAKAFYNIGNALQELGHVEQAIEAYNEALSLKPDYAEAFWNLSHTAKNISEAKNWIEQCLQIDPYHLNAKLTLSALKYYEGNQSDYNSLLKTPQKDHPFIRSFAWAFKLPKLPPLYFHSWALFDQMIELSKKDRPFYEFGVWRGESFKYMIKTLKKGYGFDTFEGLPEDWHTEKAGTYTSDGDIPKIKGGNFIVGKFEDTLPGFFAESRPMASIINFDADLYSSTICALNFAKPVIDQHTILIFDEFLMNDNWEQDEYKALEEFCVNSDCTYKVLAISFMTKQVAVRIVGA